MTDNWKIAVKPCDATSNVRWIDFPLYRHRRDGAGERAIIISLDLQRYLSTTDAARFLREQGFDLDTTMRVLTRPAQRRRVRMD